MRLLGQGVLISSNARTLSFEARATTAIDVEFLRIDDPLVYFQQYGLHSQPSASRINRLRKSLHSAGLFRYAVTGSTEQAAVHHFNIDAAITSGLYLVVMRTSGDLRFIHTKPI